MSVWRSSSPMSRIFHLVVNSCRFSPVSSTIITLRFEAFSPFFHATVRGSSRWMRQSTTASSRATPLFLRSNTMGSQMFVRVFSSNPLCRVKGGTYSMSKLN